MDDWRPIAPEDDVDPPAGPGRGRERLRGSWKHARSVIRWVGVGRIITAAVTVPLIGIGGFLLLRTPAAPVEANIEYASTLPGSSLSTADSSPGRAASVTVHVAGHVRSPGVYALFEGQRIVDAIRAAGGADPVADLNAINLAIVVTDGDQVYVPAVGETTSAVSSRIGSPIGAEQQVFPVNINSASATQLEELPGIGPSTAAAIVAHRERYGPFTTVTGLLEVPGIGTAKFEAIENLVQV